MAWLVAISSGKRWKASVSLDRELESMGSKGQWKTWISANWKFNDVTTRICRRMETYPEIFKAVEADVPLI